MICGSKLFGLSTPESDTDYKGIYIPKAEDILLNKVPNTSKSKTGKGGDIDDVEMFTLLGFMKMVSQGQTVAVEMLFTPDEFIIETSDLWKVIQARRDRLIHKNISPFVGYCKTQANKYSLKYERVQVLEEVVGFLKKEYADWEKENKELYSNGLKRKSKPKVGDVIPAMKHMFPKHPDVIFDVTVDTNEVSGYSKYYVDICFQKTQYSLGLDDALEQLQAKLDKYGARAKALKSNFDGKAFSHACRVGFEAVELLDKGYITLPLIQRELLLDIKLGKMSLEDVSGIVEQNLEDINVLLEVTKIPEKADQGWIDSFVKDIYTKKILGEQK